MRLSLLRAGRTMLRIGAFVVVAAACGEPRSSLDRRGIELIWAGEQRLEADDATEFDQFGYSVSLGPDRALVGAYGNQDYRGAVYAFVKSGNSWTAEQKLTASDGADGDSFGWSVSLSGDRALVGAYAREALRGAAYVFVRTGSTWTFEQELVATERAEGDRFGWSVSLSGDRALVGAYGSDGLHGAAYVFARNESSWTLERKLVASDGLAGEYLGYSVSLAGGRALIGAPSSEAARGRALVFVEAGGSWTEEQELLASDGVFDVHFGVSVSLAEERALVGAYWDDSLRGAAYTFLRTGDSWSEEQKLIARGASPGHRFGNSTSLSSDRALIGAYASGAAYVFVRSGDSWTEEQRLVASDGAQDTLFGWSVSLAEGRALVGAHYDDNLRGAAYLVSLELTLGEACSADVDCQSGFCADGVCCDAACLGPCVACAAALKGHGEDGRCAPIVAGTDPKDECTDDGAPTCEANGLCDGAGSCGRYPETTSCRPEPCLYGVECSTGTCEDGICCDRGCALSERCRAELKVSGGDGTCGPALTAALGLPCASDDHCTSGHCADGVCCKSGDCESPPESNARGDGAGCACRAGRISRHIGGFWLAAALGLLRLFQNRRIARPSSRRTRRRVGATTLTWVRTRNALTTCSPNRASRVIECAYPERVQTYTHE